jgi:peptidoglycan/LPS O-acetylase OafA/YrhL
MVLLYHYGNMAWTSQWLEWGWAGVDLFFVLSGFLITGILYDSLHRNDFFRSFYIRRSLRIFPVFYGFWLLLLVLTPLIHVQWNRYNVALAAYIGNFFFPGMVMGPHFPPGVLKFTLPHAASSNELDFGHLWSLCIEEQFYLVWPAVVWFVRSRITLLRICLAVIVLCPIGRALCLHFDPLSLYALYFNTFARVDTLLVGAALALWLRGPAIATTTIRRTSWALLLILPLVLAAYRHFETNPARDPSFDPFVLTIGFTLVAITAAAAVLLSIDNASPISLALRFTPLAFLGRISYGLYFFHKIPSLFVYYRLDWLKTHHLTLLVILIPLVFAVTVAWLSFRYLESPFLRLKSILAPRPGAVPDPKPVPAS